MAMRILVLTHEQRLHWSKEPGYDECLRPLSEVENLAVAPYCYQRAYRQAFAQYHENSNPQRRSHLAWSFVYEDICATAEIFKPDIILNLLTWHNESIPADFIESIRSKHCANLVTVFFDHDENNLSMLMDEKSIMESSALNLVADSPLRVSRIQRKEHPYTSWSHRIEVCFQPVPVSQKAFAPRTKRFARICCAGTPEGYRKTVWEFLSNSRHANRLLISGGIFNSGEFTSFDTYSDMISSSLMNVVTDTQHYRSQIKGRAFQVLSCGSSLLIQNNKDVSSYFSSELVFKWENPEHLLQGIDYTLSSPRDAIQKALEARRVYANLVNPKAFMANIIKRLWL